MFLLLTFQRVQDEYASGGWIKHHTQMLEYEETKGENSKSFITFQVTEPANEKQKDWEVTLITSNRVRYTCSLLLLFELFDFQLSYLLHAWICVFVC